MAAVIQAKVDRERVRHTVVGCPGVPDRTAGQARSAPNMAGIYSIDFQEAVEQQTGTKVC